jgi:hypothetical protein
LCRVMCCARSPSHTPSLFSFALSSIVLGIVIVQYAMPKVNPRNEVGVIVHAVYKNVLGNHTTKNIYGNVNYAKTFIQGTVVIVFNGRLPGGEE